MSFILSKLTQAVIITYKFLSPSLPTIFLVICYLHKTFFLAFSTSQCMLFRKHQADYFYWLCVTVLTAYSAIEWQWIAVGTGMVSFKEEYTQLTPENYLAAVNIIHQKIAFVFDFHLVKKRPYQICKLERSIPIPHKICKDRNRNNVL